MVQSASVDEDIQAKLRYLDAGYEIRIAALQLELDELCRRFRDERRLRVQHLGGADGAGAAPSSATSASPASIADASAFIAGAARRALEGLPEDGEVLGALQGSSSDAHSLARACDSVFERAESGLDSAAYKKALPFLRDLLVLKVCSGAGRPWNNVGLELAFSRVFDRPLESKDKLTSQLILAFNKIICCGRDREVFSRTVDRSYGEPPDAETAEKLFEAFRACARTSPRYTSKTKQVHKGKPRPKPKKKPCGGSAEEDAPAADGPNTSSEEAASEDVARGPATADHTLRPWNLNVKNTFFHVEVQSCSRSRGWKTCPPFDLQDFGEETAEASPQFKGAQTCGGCGAGEDPGGWWRAKEKMYLCERCWGKRIKTTMADVSQHVRDVLRAGGPAKRYESLDRAVLDEETKMKTEVRVTSQCCLRAAKECGPGACLLVMGREHGPLAEHRHGQAGDVIRGSALKLAVDATDPKDFNKSLPAPRWGGIFVPDVLVVQDSSDTPFEPPFRVSMIYATAARGGDGARGEDGSSASGPSFAEEMREKTLNVLRACHKEGCSELILGAWGCAWRKGDPRIVAEVFRDALLGEGSDVAGAFRRVTFAILGETDRETFEEVFEPHAVAASWAASGDCSAGAAPPGFVFQ